MPRFKSAVIELDRDESDLPRILSQVQREVPFEFAGVLWDVTSAKGRQGKGIQLTCKPAEQS